MLNLRSFLLSAVTALSVFAATSQLSVAASASNSIQGDVYRVVEFVSSDANEIKLSTVVKGAAANDPYAARFVAIKQSRFASWFKPNLGSLIKANLWWMGFAAIVESAGWAIDEIKGQVTQKDPAIVPGYYFHVFVYPYGFRGSTPIEACKTYPSKSEGGRNKVENGLCVWYRYDTGVRQGSYQIMKQQCNVDTASLASCNGTAVMVPVSDADLQAAINTQLAADPSHAATAFTDPETGRGYDELFDPVPYIPGLTQSDEALVGCYRSGQLQMTNPSGACYVASQAEYDRIKKLADDLAAGKTPEEQAEILNQQMKQPITQAEFEQSNQKFSDAVNSVTESVRSQNESDYSGIDENFNKLDGIITDLPNTTLPAPAHISVPQYVDCQQLTLSDGNGHELVFPSPAQCAKIETFKQGFGYFLAISVVFLLGMQLLTRPHG